MPILIPEDLTLPKMIDEIVNYLKDRQKSQCERLASGMLLGSELMILNAKVFGLEETIADLIGMKNKLGKKE